jgi:hypothetical protein
MGVTSRLKMPFQHQNPFVLQLREEACHSEAADARTDDNNVRLIHGVDDGGNNQSVKQTIAVVWAKHGTSLVLMHGFSWDKATTGKPAERLALIPA